MSSSTSKASPGIPAPTTPKTTVAESASTGSKEKSANKPSEGQSIFTKVPEGRLNPFGSSSDSGENLSKKKAASPSGIFGGGFGGSFGALGGSSTSTNTKGSGGTSTNPSTSLFGGSSTNISGFGGGGAGTNPSGSLFGSTPNASFGGKPTFGSTKSAGDVSGTKTTTGAFGYGVTEKDSSDEEDEVLSAEDIIDYSDEDDNELQTSKPLFGAPALPAFGSGFGSSATKSVAKSPSLFGRSKDSHKSTSSSK